MPIYIDPHIHMISRVTDDYQRMAQCGCIAITEPAPTMVLARVGSKPLNSPYSEPYDFFSPHARIVNFAFADGSVRGLSSTVDPLVLQALATRSSGEVVDGSAY